MKLPVLTPGDKLAEIRRLYYQTTRQTMKEDFARALQLLKSMGSEEERERAAVYMDGLSQMRSDWAQRSKKVKGKSEGTRQK
jgi:ABC-type dipeptide/oligopeptide/nickel transport system ATPase component